MDKEDVDYILQAIGNELRRKILLYVAREGPISYTKLMKMVGVDDSGTFGFHLRKMQRLLKKDDMGEYVLSDLGVRAIKFLEKIGYVGVSESQVERNLASSKSTIEGDKVKVIGDMGSYSFGEDVARMYLEKGYRIIFRNIIKLRIGKMPRDLFDRVVEEISDCLTVYCPNSLRDLVELKSKQVFRIKSNDRGTGKSLESINLGFISNIVSGVVSTALDLVPKFVSQKFGEFGKLVVDREFNSRDLDRIEIDCSGGLFEVRFGDVDRLKIWSKHREPETDIDRRDDSLHMDLSGERVELSVSKKSIDSLYVDISGGVGKLDSGLFNSLTLEVGGGLISFHGCGFKNSIKLDVNGGAVNLDARHLGGRASIEGEVSSGVLKINILVRKGVKLIVDNNIVGGFVNITRNGEHIPNKYSDTTIDSSGDVMFIKLDVSGGLVNIFIKED